MDRYCSSTLLLGGRTVHSLFKLLVPLLETCASTCNVTLTSKLANMLRAQSLFIIDEASMHLMILQVQTSCLVAKCSFLVFNIRRY